LVIDPADVNVTPDAIATVSPLSPSVTVPQSAVGVILLTLTSLILPYCSWTNFIYFYFTHNLPIEICTLLLLYHFHHFHQDLVVQRVVHLHHRQY